MIVIIFAIIKVHQSLSMILFLKRWVKTVTNTEKALVSLHAPAVKLQRHRQRLHPFRLGQIITKYVNTFMTRQLNYKRLKISRGFVNIGNLTVSLIMIRIMFGELKYLLNHKVWTFLT